MQYRTITRIIGLLIALFSIAMLPPAAVSLIYAGDGTSGGGGLAFLQSFFICLFVGLALWYPNRHQRQELRNRSGFLIVVLFWVVLGSIGALPFLLIKEGPMPAGYQEQQRAQSIQLSQVELNRDLNKLHQLSERVQRLSKEASQANSGINLAGPKSDATRVGALKEMSELARSIINNEIIIHWLKQHPDPLRRSEVTNELITPMADLLSQIDVDAHDGPLALSDQHHRFSFEQFNEFIRLIESARYEAQLKLVNTQELGLANSFFESFSALTTTGATVMTNLEGWPKSILFYRHQLQWLGGMGIIVLAVAILPLLGVGGMQLYRAETPGPVKDNKMTPRIAETAKALWYIYLTLTVLCAIAYWLAGMSVFDAIGHSFSTIAIGGFSSYDASIGHFNSTAINMVCVVFLLISAINFSLHFAAFSSKGVNLKAYLRDTELRFFVLIQVVLVLVCFIVLYNTAIYPTPEDTLEHALFQAVSVSTTAGFGTQSFSAWPLFLPMLLIFSSFIGGCAGSTGGGMKVIRVVLLFLQGSREMKRLVHPKAMYSIRLGNKALSDRVIDAVWGFFSAYALVFVICMVALMATGLDDITAFSATAACLNNLGPGLGEVAANYQNISDTAKWILSIAMVCGRLEVFTLLVLFTPTFWKT
ncbi:hypothetical protein GCM10007894_27970 [Paraferrimonas haliotis]|uniref:Trk system potassium uptake protein n=1 Tax=Paraferrimonas haliotis TaxID=2013866 RepID=A0AA37TYY5_9GAMM|nr:hypothetical protein GCM10007894_27970 [Paraferrimonas haliotis]